MITHPFGEDRIPLTGRLSVYNSTTGAYADPVGSCVVNQATGSHQMLIKVSQYGYDFMTVRVIDPSGNGGWEGWSGISSSYEFRRTVTGYRAMQILFADRTVSGQWVYDTQFIWFGNTNWCI
jgi:hypothetical protein